MKCDLQTFGRDRVSNFVLVFMSHSEHLNTYFYRLCLNYFFLKSLTRR